MMINLTIMLYFVWEIILTMINVIILASGESSRFNQETSTRRYFFKQFVEVECQTIMEKSLDNLSKVISSQYIRVIPVIRKSIESEAQKLFSRLDEKNYAGVYKAYQLEGQDKKPIGGATGAFIAGLKCLIKSGLEDKFELGTTLMINADDLYSKNAFEVLIRQSKEGLNLNLGCYKVINTYPQKSEKAVNRGVVIYTSNGSLIDITETSITKDNLKHYSNKYASMNFISMSKDAVARLIAKLSYEDDFPEIIPDFVMKIRDDMGLKVHIVRIDSEWKGVTYKEDLEIIK